MAFQYDFLYNSLVMKHFFSAVLAAATLSVPLLSTALAQSDAKSKLESIAVGSAKIKKTVVGFPSLRAGVQLQATSRAIEETIRHDLLYMDMLKLIHPTLQTNMRIKKMNECPCVSCYGIFPKIHFKRIVDTLRLLFPQE
jgi:hypothetical protein